MTESYLDKCRQQVFLATGAEDLYDRLNDLDYDAAAAEVVKWTKRPKDVKAVRRCITWFSNPDRHRLRPPKLPRYLQDRAAAAYGDAAAAGADALLLAVACEIEAVKMAQRHAQGTSSGAPLGGPARGRHPSFAIDTSS